MKESNMNQKPSSSRKNRMRSEYDLSEGVRGKFLDAYRKGTNVILLDPDVAEVFRDSTSVNETLRPLAEILKKNTKRLRKKPRSS